ncbi:MAG: DUF4167 domain-containing protein [Alphaproteobacteria bacterium]
MRQGPPPNGRRPRSRHHGGDNRNENRGDRSGGGGGGGGNGGGNMGGPMGGNRPRSAASLRHQSFDSNCGDLRVRGNAWQVYEKYQALARDATSAGDRVGAENYLQHAEHFFRIIEAINEATALEQRQSGVPPVPPQAYGQQPEIPANYYPAAGAPAPVTGGEPNGNAQSSAPQPQQPQPQAEATVQQRNPPPSPFFTQEEIDEHNGGRPLGAAL